MGLSLTEKYNLMKGGKSFMKREVDLYSSRIAKALHPGQLEIWNDPSRRKIIICGRRFGKTVLNAALLMRMALEKTESFYINMTSTEAVNQLLPHLEMFRELTGIDGRMHHVDSIFKFSTGAIIHFRGYDSVASQRKVQGKKVTGIFILDEVQSAPNLKHYLDVYVRPMLADSPTSSILLSGTPPRTPATYLEHLWSSPNTQKIWTRYNYGMEDNPLIKERFNDILLEICTEKGLLDINGLPIVTSPFIQREYFGNMAAFDTDASVYSGRKYFDELPALIPTEIAIGVDFGFTDSNAIVGLAMDKDTKRGYVYYEDKFNKAGAQETIERCKAAYEEGKTLFSIYGREPKIACYVDHSHQHLSYDMNYRYGIPCHLATKTTKFVANDQLIDYLRSGRILIKRNGLIDTEMKQILWKRDDQDRITNDIDESIIHPDLTDALLYASRRFTQVCGKMNTF